MDFGIAGKTALVMAAGGGLGSAIAVSLAAEGVLVAVSDLDPGALESTIARIRDQGGRAMGVTSNLGDISSVLGMLDRVRAEFGDPDILVNNSGGPPPSKASNVSLETWQRQFDSMILSLIHLTDNVLPAMRARKWGRVITSTSSGVVAPIANLGISNTLRASLVGWSKTLANEVAGDGITVNVVLPGRIATSRIQSLDEARAGREGKTYQQVVAESTQSIPVGRYGKTEEYGDVVAFLASQRASFVTGSVIRVDGGMIPSI